MKGKVRYLPQWGKGTASYEATVFLRDTGQIPWTLRLLFSNLKRVELCKMTTINFTKEHPLYTMLDITALFR